MAQPSSSQLASLGFFRHSSFFQGLRVSCGTILIQTADLARFFIRHSSFVIRHFPQVRHSSFVIRHFPQVRHSSFVIRHFFRGSAFHAAQSLSRPLTLPGFLFVIRHSSFVISLGFVIRHSSFVISLGFVIRHSLGDTKTCC